MWLGSSSEPELSGLGARGKILAGVVCRHFSVVTACPECDYEVEVDPLDLFRLSDKFKPHCLNCWCALSVRVRESATDSVAMGSSLP